MANVPARKEGTRGRSLVVTVNAFAITKLPSKPFHHYDVITPPAQSPRRAHEIIDRLQTSHAPQIFNPRALYDGKANLYASHELRLPGGGSGSFQFSMSDRPASKFAIYEVKITRAAASVIQPSDVHQLIRNGTETPQTKTATNIMQLLVNAAPNLKYPHNARSYFTSVGSRPIGGGLELWTGFFQSVRPSLGRMLVNVDVSIAPMYRSGSLVDLCLDILKCRDLRDLYLSENSPQFRRLKSMLKGVVITTRRQPDRRRSIKGLVPEAGGYMFDKRDNSGNEQTISVKDYFASLGTPVQFPKLFGVRTGRDAVMPAEFCTVVPGQIYKKKLSPEHTKQMVDTAKKRPEERLNLIITGVDSRSKSQSQNPALEYKNSDFMHDVEMEVSQQPLTVQGRVLDTPNVIYDGNRSKKPAGGAWNVVQQKFRKPAKLLAWGVVNFAGISSSQSTVLAFVQTFMSCCAELGLNVASAPPPYMVGNPQSVEQSLNELCEMILRTNQAVKRPLLIMVILPISAADIRRRVKRWGDIQNGIPTQCIKEDKIRRANNQYCNNVALKVNVRLGGGNSLVDSRVLRELSKAPYMIVGADVSHPGPGQGHQPSIASLVWSWDQYATEYIAFSRVQNPRQEELADLGPMMLDALILFATFNKAPPQRIIFFRDGVSEGEYEAVMKNEIASIDAAIEELWQKAPKGARRTPITVTFIIVGKRHHVRFFPNQRDADKTGNCPAGFIADKGLSSPIAFDFYLLSHGGLLGTSRPAHYIVLKDDNFNNNVDDLQELAFALCHVYVRATRSVSIPAPVYYADLVCSRAKDFYFTDAAFFGDDMTVTSGEMPPFDIHHWRENFDGTKINAEIRKSMYFL